MTDQKDKANYAFLSGLLLGWESAMNDPKEILRLRKDMRDWSKKLSKLAGVYLKENE